MPRLPVYALAAAAALPLGAALCAAAPEPASGTPRRIVSLNLCSDQLLIELADPAQIAGLTRNARDAQLSAEAVRARSLPVLGNSAEEVLAINPDLVLGVATRRSAAVGVLKRQHYRTIDLRNAKTFNGIVKSIRETASAVGHPDRGEAMIVRMQRDLDAIRHIGNGKVAAHYQRSGFLTGTGTLIDELMGHTGLINLASRLGKPALSQLSLEELVAARPDYLIVEGASDYLTDQGTEMLHHPALRNIPRIRLPQAWTVCGTQHYVRAARSMAEQIAAHR